MAIKINHQSFLNVGFRTIQSLINYPVVVPVLSGLCCMLEGGIKGPGVNVPPQSRLVWNITVWIVDFQTVLKLQLLLCHERKAAADTNSALMVVLHKRIIALVVDICISSCTKYS